MNLYLKRILSKKQRFNRFDACSRHWPCCASLSVAGKTAIGVNANQGIPGNIVERHRGNSSDLYLLRLVLGEQAKAGQTRAHWQPDCQTHECPATPVTVTRFDHFHLLASRR